MALDDDDKKEIAALIAEQMKAGNAETKKAIDATVAAALKGLDLDKKFGELETKLTPPPKDPPDTKGNSGGIEDDPAFKKMKAELEAQRKATEAQAKRAEEEAKARQAEALTNGVSQALVAAGADPKRAKMALAYLTSQGVVKLDDKGQPVFAFRREWGEELKAAGDGGAAEWLGTEDGKMFVPPVATQGTGDGSGRPQGGGGGANADVNSIIGRALGTVFG